MTTDLKYPPRCRQPKVSRSRKTEPLDWKRIRREHAIAAKRQLEGIESQEIFKLSVEAKLREAGAEAHCQQTGESWFNNFMRCGRESFFMLCPNCGDGQDCHYQCSQKWCPRCNWRISMKRKEMLETMTEGMYGVKHVVLTQRNFETLSRQKIMASRKHLFDLRRQRIFGSITGGCASLEFTNEGRGWHMHWHLLVQSKFVPASELSIAWGRLVGQEFAIVKVMDVTEKSYVAELCKYVVSGSEIAKWKPQQILEFITSLRSTRCFTTFGQFRLLQKFARQHLLAEKSGRQACNCGCSNRIFGTDEAMCNRLLDKGIF